jgi:hypothetical protein
MNKSMSIFLLLVFSVNSVYAESKSLKETCDTTPLYLKYAIKLYEQEAQIRRFQICRLDDFIGNGDSCEEPDAFSYNAPTEWHEIVDLNGDGHPDLIISFHTTVNAIGPYGIRSQYDSRAYFVMANCSDDSYITVGEDFFFTLALGNTTKKNGWLELIGTRQHEEETPGGISYFHKWQNIVFRFNPEIFKYEVAKEVKETKSRTPLPHESATTEGQLSKFNIHWNEFPPSLKRFLVPKSVLPSSNTVTPKAE